MTEATMTAALNKLCKWRTILCGWHLGSASKDKPGVQAMRDLADKWLLMRVEGNALAQLMLDKGVFTVAEFQDQMTAKAVELDKSMAKQFPGFRSADFGMEIFDIALAAETTKRLGFPE